jgi:hypothetical protein
LASEWNPGRNIAVHVDEVKVYQSKLDIVKVAAGAFVQLWRFLNAEEFNATGVSPNVSGAIIAQV